MTQKSFVKMLVGRRNVEDALLRLDLLTREEYLMVRVVARNLDVTHHVDRVVRDIRGNLELSRILKEDIDYSTQATMALTNDVSQKIMWLRGSHAALAITLKQVDIIRNFFKSAFTNVPTPFVFVLKPCADIATNDIISSLFPRWCPFDVKWLTIVIVHKRP